MLIFSKHFLYPKVQLLNLWICRNPNEVLQMGITLLLLHRSMKRHRPKSHGGIAESLCECVYMCECVWVCVGVVGARGVRFFLIHESVFQTISKCVYCSYSYKIFLSNKAKEKKKLKEIRNET